MRLIGNLRAQDIEEVKAEVARPGQVVLDIGELALVSREGISFLNSCQDDGIGIVNASQYISEWMLLERESGRSPR